MDRHLITQELWTFTKAHVRSCIRGKQDQEDLVQDILRRYVELADEFLPLMPDEEFKYLAVKVARNMVRDFVKIAKRRSQKSVPFYARERTTKSHFEQVHAKLLLEEIRDRLDSVGAFSLGRSQYYEHLKKIKETIEV